MNAFSPIPARRLLQNISIHRPDRQFMDIVTLNDPARVVMTDLKRVTAVTIEPDAPLSTAESRMRQRGVRSLLVVDESEEIVGLITSTDVAGEKPLQHVQQFGGTRRQVPVHALMTARDQLEVLCMKDVEQARVGDVVETLKQSGRQHALVVDHPNLGGAQMLRGIFSASQIARQLDMEIPATEIARTFAEIESLLAHA